VADPVIWKIVDGQLGLALVDRQEVGYSDTWRAPGGKTVDTVTLADYEAASASFMCQVTTARITSTPSTTTEEVEATMCAPAKTIPTPGESSFALEVGALSDATEATGLQRYAYEWDAQEVYVYVGYNNGDPPQAIGRVFMAALAIGGPMRAKLAETVTWPFVFKPQVAFGDATTSAPIPPNAAPLGATTEAAEAEAEAEAVPVA
jgi:hypothetical protein